MDLFTVSEAARFLRISTSTAYLMIERGQLPAIRIGRTIRIPKKDLEQLVEIQVRKYSAELGLGKAASA